MSKKVLITGGAGFIAHHTILHILKNTDWEIVSLDRLDYSGNLNRIADIMSDLDSETKKTFENSLIALNLPMLSDLLFGNEIIFSKTSDILAAFS